MKVVFIQIFHMFKENETLRGVRPKNYLTPKVDFVFKNIFGSPKHPRVLISFLNATLKPVNKIRSLETSMEEIRDAKDELVRLSNDSKQREIFEMRSKILKDKISALNEAERKGIEKGKLEIAKNLLEILDDETISLKTGLSIKEIRKLRGKN